MMPAIQMSLTFSSSNDTVGIMISCRYQTSGKGNYTSLQAGKVSRGRGRAEFLSKSTPNGKLWNSPKTQAAWSNSPVKGIVL